jgi:hypothetical protein
MIEIKGIHGGIPMVPEDVERERLKEIKTRLGKIAFTTIFGDKAKVMKKSDGIAKAEGALKWMDEVLNGDKWKDS